jgi:hypothetical protein
MNLSPSRWWFLNPIELLKLAYETFGAKYPAVSLIAVMLLGALFFGAVWHVAARQYEKDQISNTQTPVITAPQTGAATTSGPNSPANTGNGNSFSYQEPPPTKKSAVQPKKADKP